MQKFDVSQERWKVKINQQGMADVVKENDSSFRIGYVIVEDKNQLARAEDIVRAKLVAAAPKLLAVMYILLDEACNCTCTDDIRNIIEEATGVRP